MTSPHALQLVRESLAFWLAQQHPGETFRPQESILVRDGFYCGRRFSFADYQAVWFVEEGVIKIYTLSGEMLARLAVQAATPSTGEIRRAA